MKRKEIGAALLVAGCSIGAGMLGVPVITGPGGFLPAVVCFFLAWLFMLSTGLVLVDLVLRMQLEEKEEVHLITLASHSFGRLGVLVVWALFSFLFYCVLTAYMLGGSSLVTAAAGGMGFSVSQMTSSLLVAFGGALIVLFGARTLDRLNRFLMFGLISTYFALIITAVPNINVDHLTRSAWVLAPLALPVMIISFGYHNLVPSLVSYLDRDRKAIRRSIILGSVVPLIIYIVWEVAILGVVPYTTPRAWEAAIQSGDMVTTVLANTSGALWVVRASEAFAFFALVTSFLPVSFSFVDFLRDAMRAIGIENSNGASKTICLILAVFVPPLVVSLTNPHLFLDALSAAGGYAAVTLFGILPAVMAIKLKLRSRAFMGLLVLIALMIMGIEFCTFLTSYGK